MAHLAHETKKVLNRASTSKRSLHEGISAEFEDCRRRLHDISIVIKSLNKCTQSTRQVWTNVAKHQRDFTETLAAAFPRSGEVQAHAAEVETTIRDVQMRLNDEDSQEAAHHRMINVLDQYLGLLNAIESDYTTVETAYTEKMRYERKVDKLEKKADKKPGALQRNLRKLKSAREDYDTKLATALARMRSAVDKHEAVLQCAHHAFWMANQTFSSIINNATQSIRSESVAVHKHLLNIDVQAQQKIEPVPRLKMITDEGAPSSDSSLSTSGSDEHAALKTLEHYPASRDDDQVTVEQVDDEDSDDSEDYVDAIYDTQARSANVSSPVPPVTPHGVDYPTPYSPPNPVVPAVRMEEPENPTNVHYSTIITTETHKQVVL